jgi:hypothetical protein
LPNLPAPHRAFGRLTEVPEASQNLGTAHGSLWSSRESFGGPQKLRLRLGIYGGP